MMKKEEILAMSKRTGLDEREEKIETDSSSYGLITVLVLVLFFGGWKLIHGVKDYELIPIFTGYITAVSLYKFKKFQSKRFLIAAVLGILSTIAGMIVFFLEA